MTQSPSFFALQYDAGELILLDQTVLPNEERYVRCRSLEDVARAIETMIVRGAPAIGLSAAYGICIACRQGSGREEARARLAKTRPTAVNLFYALQKMSEVDYSIDALEAEAHRLFAEDAKASRRLGELGAALVPDGATILTHCNAGALGTARLGTALAVIRCAHESGKRIRVYADETRPRLQGARLTAWELMKDGIDVTIIPDGAASHFIGRGEIDLAIVGADRVARNGDVANKIGTRGVAASMFLAGRPFYVAAPWSTIDLDCADGDRIPIEERDVSEVTHVGSVLMSAPGAKVKNPAFDVTPAAWITALITERGIIEAPLPAGIERLR